MHVASPRLSTPQAAKQFTRNMGLGMKYAIPNLLDNTLLLKNNSLIVASLILVISRILVANLSALKAKGTPQGPYRYQESMRTTIRESAGWTLSFAVLRQFQTLIKKGMRRIFGILDVDPSTPTTFSEHVSKNIRALVKREHLDAPVDWVDPAREGSFNYLDNQASQKAIAIMRKIPGLAQKDGQTLMKGFYRLAPIIVGSLPSIIIGGFALEALTRDKSDQVINGVSRVFHHGKSTEQAGNNQSSQFGAISSPTVTPNLQPPTTPQAGSAAPAAPTANPFSMMPPAAPTFSPSPL